MAKGQFLSPYQKGVVKRYYENKENLMTQKLGELVSEIYLNTSEKKAWALWERARLALYHAGANKARVDKLCNERNLEALAKILTEIF